MAREAGMFARRADRRAAQRVLLSTGVCLVHAGLLAMVAYQPPRRSESVPVRVVAAELILATPATPVTASPPPSIRHPAMRTVSSDRVAEPERAQPTAPPVAPPAAMAAEAAPATATPSAPAPSNAAVLAAAAPTLASPATPKSVAHLDCAIVKPEYPALSRRRGEAGTVVIELVTDADGRVESARVFTSSGYARLDDAARGAALASRCARYTENGTALRARATLPIRFNLSD